MTKPPTVSKSSAVSGDVDFSGSLEVGDERQAIEEQVAVGQPADTLARLLAGAAVPIAE